MTKKSDKTPEKSGAVTMEECLSELASLGYLKEGVSDLSPKQLAELVAIEIEYERLTNRVSPSKRETPSNDDSSDAVEAPTCPECGGELLLRQNRESGQEFYGCRNFWTEGCKGTRPVQEVDGQD